MDLAIAMEQGIGKLMALVAAGVHPSIAFERSTRENLPEEYKWGDKRNIEYQIWKHLRGMEGDPQFRGKDPNNWWKRVIANILEFFDSIKG
jgi:hypothetical protein